MTKITIWYKDGNSEIIMLEKDDMEMIYFADIEKMIIEDESR